MERGTIADLRAEAWSAYGNAQRICGNFLEAEEAFDTAFQHLEKRTGSPYVQAILRAQLSALRNCQSCFQAAIELAQEAGEIYRGLGEAHLLAGTMMQMATARLYSGEAESAEDLLLQTLPLLDRKEDPYLFLAAHHNLARCHVDLGQPEEAIALHFKARELYAECREPLILLRATWQEGQILREVGHLRNAEAALLRARQGYAEQGLAYEAALVSLDLAEVYSKLDLLPELRRILGEALPIFRALKVGPETLASLLRLQQAAGQQDDSS